MSLPFEIQNDLDLFSRNEELRSLRSSLITSVSKMDSGTFSIKKEFSSVVNDMVTVIDVILKRVVVTVIPKDDYSDFESGLLTLDTFASFDLMKYYNDLQKLKFYLNGITVALQSLQDITPVPLTPSSISDTGVLASLNSKEFIEQGSDSPVFETIQDYKYYTIIQGDTLQKIAIKVYAGEINKWVDIAHANNLSDNDLLDNDLVGQIIKIPIINSAKSISTFNLVYETFFDGITASAIEQFTYGRDIKVVNGKFQISGSGDLQRISGIKSVVQNIQDRFNNTKGSLNSLNTNWGILPLNDTKKVPFAIHLDRLLTDMERQAMLDPRVVSATVKRNKLVLSGDRLDIEMDIILIGGKSIKEIFNALTQNG